MSRVVFEDLRADLAKLGLAALGGPIFMATAQPFVAKEQPKQVVVDKQTRGARNNNPTNLVFDQNDWDGRVAKDDSGFAVFDNLGSGFRAAVKNFVNNQKKGGVISLEQYIRKFASTSKEADKSRYVKFVADKLGVDRRVAISVLDPYEVVAAQSEFESGVKFTPQLKAMVRKLL